MNAGKEAKTVTGSFHTARPVCLFLSGDTPLQEAASSQRQRWEGPSELQLAAAVQTGEMDLSHLIPRLVILSAPEFVRDNLVGVVHSGYLFWAAAQGSRGVCDFTAPCWAGDRTVYIRAHTCPHLLQPPKPLKTGFR